MSRIEGKPVSLKGPVRVDGSEEEHNLVHRMATLVETSAALLAMPGSGDAIHKILDLAQRFVAADAYAVWRKAGETPVWKLVSSEGLSPDYERIATENINVSVPESFIACEDVFSEALLESRWPAYRKEGIRSILCVPLQIHGKPTGTVVFYYHEQRCFSLSERTIASALGSLAAAALAGAELYEQQTRSRLLSEAAERRARFVADAGEVLSSSLEYETTLKSVAKLAIPTFADWCAVDVIADGKLTCVALVHSDSGKLALVNEYRRRFPRQPDEPSQNCLRTGEAIIIKEVSNSVLAERLPDPDQRSMFRALQLQSVIIAPMMARGRALGLLKFAISGSDRRYSEDDLHLARELARRAAIAIDNAALYEQVRQLNQDLQSQVRDFETLLEVIPVGVAVATDPECRDIKLNPTFGRMLGISTDANASKTGPGGDQLPFTMYKDGREVAGEDLPMQVAAREKRDVEDVEFDIVQAGGTRLKELCFAKPLFDESGQVRGSIGVFLDITERKRAEEALRESEARFRGVFESSPLGIILAQTDARIVEVNPAFCRMLGYSEPELIGRNIADITHSEDVGLPERFLQDADGGVRSWFQIEQRYINKSGNVIVGCLNTSILRDASDQTQYLLGVVEDITERKRIEQALHESEEERKMALEAGGMGTWRWDAELHQCRWNATQEALLGFAPGTFDGTEAAFLERLLPAHRETVLRAIQLTLDTGQQYQCEHGVRLPDGQIRWLNSRGRVFLGPDGRAAGVTGVSWDVTAHKRMEAAVQASEERYRRIVETAAEGIWTVNTRGRTTFVNRRLAELLGATPEALMDKWAFDFVFDEDRPRALELFRTSARQMLDAYDFRLRRVDGSPTWVSISASPLRDDGGNPLGVLAMFTDVEERMRAEEALKAREEESRTLLANLPDVVSRFNRDLRFLYVSPAVQRSTGVPPEEYLGKTHAEAGLPPPLAELLEARLREIFDAGEPRYVEFELPSPDGRRRTYLGIGVPEFGPDGRVATVLTIVRDTSEQKLAEEELLRSNGALRRMNANLKEFAFAASHDLQEPLRMVALYSQLLTRRYSSRLDADANRYLAVLDSSARRMQMLVNDLLAFTHAAETLSEPAMTVNCEAVLETAKENLAVAITQNKAVITHDPLPLVSGHPTHITQLFQNLISNSTTYRKENELPRIHISVEPAGPAWLFSVSDNGIGIDPQYASRIFGVFKRLHKDKYPGTGIGLAICARVVERYGGRIWVDSEGEGKGSTFRFTLPAAVNSESSS